MKYFATKALLVVVIIPSTLAGFLWEVISDTFGYGRRSAVEALDEIAERFNNG